MLWKVEIIITSPMTTDPTEGGDFLPRDRAGETKKRSMCACVRACVIQKLQAQYWAGVFAKVHRTIYVLLLYVFGNCPNVD